MLLLDDGFKHCRFEFSEAAPCIKLRLLGHHGSFGFRVYRVFKRFCIGKKLRNRLSQRGAGIDCKHFDVIPIQLAASGLENIASAIIECDLQICSSFGELFANLTQLLCKRLVYGKVKLGLLDIAVGNDRLSFCDFRGRLRRIKGFGTSNSSSNFSIPRSRCCAPVPLDSFHLHRRKKTIAKNVMRRTPENWIIAKRTSMLGTAYLSTQWFDLN